MQQNHPRIELFLSHWITYLQRFGKKSEGEYYDILQILWNTFLDDASKDKILSYKQEGRVIKLCENIFEKYHLKHLAKYPQEFEKVFYSVVGGIDISKSHLLEAYYKLVYEWFCWEISQLDISSQHEKNILQSLKLFWYNDAEKFILLDILKEVGDISKIQKLVRAYQALMNHSFYRFEGKVFSRFSFEVFSNYALHTGEEMKNKEDFFERILKWYQYIAEYLDWEKKDISEQRTSFLHRFDDKNIKLTQEKIDYYFPYPEYNVEYIPILRHSYDWYIRIIPEEINTLSPVQLWAWWLTFLHEIYDSVWEKHLPKNYPQISFLQRNEFLKHKWEKYTYKISYPAEFAFDDLLTEYPHIDEYLFFPRLTEKQEKTLHPLWEKIRTVKMKQKDQRDY